jgi:hypothetical protein
MQSSQIREPELLKKQEKQHPPTANAAGRTTAGHWIYSAGMDFWAIHGGCGLIVLPVVALSTRDFDFFPAAIMLYALTLGLPHLAATHVRLSLDGDCRSRFAWLRTFAPLAIIGAVAVVLYVLNMMPYLVLAWFGLQTWHANRQNFGIMRRYMRMAGSAPESAVNRCAEALVELFPWATVLYAALYQETRYLGYPITFPPLDWLRPIALPFWAFNVCLLVAYVVLEIRQKTIGKFVPGRLLCCISGCVVNYLAWVYVDDISWGYLVVSVWHALQYITYVHGFRSQPPAGADTVRLSLVKHLAIIFAGGVAMFLGLNVLRTMIPVFAVFHLSLNFHHYLSDALIWRRSPARTPSV